jgi:hypothetical protein
MSHGRVKAIGVDCAMLGVGGVGVGGQGKFVCLCVCMCLVYNTVNLNPYIMITR